jgi:hypothetical protein
LRKHAWILAAALALTLPAAVAAPALGAVCREVQFADSATVGGAELVLNGMGLRKVTFLKVKVYVAGLYLGEATGDAGRILGSNQPWRLALHFLREVEASDIRDAFLEGFEKATGVIPDELRPRIEALNAMMVDFEEGDSLAFANDPAKGVTAEINGGAVGAIEGADFAVAFLSIWLGPEPPNEDLKSGLLGGACE